MPTMCSGTCQLPALSSIPWRTCRNPRRPLLTSSQAAAHQTDVKTQLSQEETQKALQYQIDRSTKQEPSGAAQQEQQPKEYEKDLTVKARSKSVNTLAALRTDSAGLSKQQQDMALKRLLGQSWQVAAAHPVAVDEDEEDEFSEE